MDRPPIGKCWALNNSHINKIMNNTKRQKCEVYTRVVGYLRPVAQFNKGKEAEYEDRKLYKLNK